MTTSLQERFSRIAAEYRFCVGLTEIIGQIQQEVQRPASSDEEISRRVEALLKSLPTTGSTQGFIRQVRRCLRDEHDAGIEAAARREGILVEATGEKPQKRQKQSTSLYTFHLLDVLYKRLDLFHRLFDSGDGIDALFAEAEKKVVTEVREGPFLEQAQPVLRQDREEIRWIERLYDEIKREFPRISKLDLPLYFPNFPESMYNALFALYTMSGRSMDLRPERNEEESILAMDTVRIRSIRALSTELQEIFALSKSLPEDLDLEVLNIVFADVVTHGASKEGVVQEVVTKLSALGHTRLAEFLRSFHERIRNAELTLLMEICINKKLEGISPNSFIEMASKCTEETKRSFDEGMTSATLLTLNGLFFGFFENISCRTVRRLFSNIIVAFRELKEMGFGQEAADTIIRRLVQCVRLDDPAFGWEDVFATFLSLPPEVRDWYRIDVAAVHDPSFISRIQTPLFLRSHSLQQQLP